jgi:hypothetical protein
VRKRSETNALLRKQETGVLVVLAAAAYLLCAGLGKVYVIAMTRGRRTGSSVSSNRCRSLSVSLVGVSARHHVRISNGARNPQFF